MERPGCRGAGGWTDAARWSRNRYQHVDVVPGLFRLREKLVIWHGHRGAEVLGEAQPADVTCDAFGQLGDQVIAEILVGEKAILQGHLKDQLRFGEAAAQIELAADRIEFAARASAAKAHRDAEFLFEVRGKASPTENALAKLAGKFLRQHIEFMDIVVRVVKELADGFEGAFLLAGDESGGAGEPRHELRKPAGEVCQCAFIRAGEEEA